MNALKAVILDWAGTTIDYGCQAPTAVFIEVFQQRGVTISPQEARAPMGMFKRDHIATIAQMPAVAERWVAVHGRPPDDVDVDAMYQSFSPLQMATLADHAVLIPGAREAAAAFRARDLKIGSCTGYTRAMMDVLAPLAADQGYAPDALVCGDEVRAGRPAPWMALHNALLLDVYPLAGIVKIGDTPVDMQEGRNAGMWTIGVALTGNEVGLSQAEAAALSVEERTSRLRIATDRLWSAGAHYVVESIADVPTRLDEIEEALARGMRP